MRERILVDFVDRFLFLAAIAPDRLGSRLKQQDATLAAFAPVDRPFDILSVA
jgi:hypothetical protein